MSITTIISPEFIISAFGLIGIFIVIFAESGLLFGFFLPGDSLLLTAGLLASRGNLNLALLLPVCVIAAVTGDSVGYWFGRKSADQLFTREESRFFKKSHLLKASDFYKKNGGKTIVLARFMPFVRTFAPIVAGAAKMNYSIFLTYNLLGGLLWGAGLPLVGYGLGRWLQDRFTTKQVDHFFLMIIIAIMFLSVYPTLVHFIKARKKL